LEEAPFLGRKRKPFVFSRKAISSGTMDDMKSNRHTISIDMLVILQHYLAKQSPQEAEFAIGLTQTIRKFAAVDDRIPVKDFADIWQKALESSRDPNFGLHFGQSSSVTHSSGILYPVMMNCPTLLAALEKQARYHNLVTDFLQLHLREEGNEIILYWEIADDSMPLDHHLVESIFCSLVMTLNEISRSTLKINAIHFAHDAPSDINEYKRIFPFQLKFNQERPAIHFNSASLNEPLLLANPQLLERFEQVAREMQAQQSHTKQWTNQLSTNIRQTLMQGEKPQLNAASAALHMSTRQLQNKLKEEGTSYQELLDDVREFMALEYLRDPQLSVCQIAFLLGFSEQSTFNHAFKRWTGQTPGVYRKNL
jgi:AraC-like DNA-binding protein